MSKIVRVTLEFDDIVKIAEGREATKFEENLHALVVHANDSDYNPFGENIIQWTEYKRKT